MGANFFDDHNYIQPDKKEVSEAQVVYALREAWVRVYKEYPSDKALAILWAKTCLETGRFKIGFWNWNFGNIKARDDEEFTMYECGEELSLGYANRLKEENPDLVDIKKIYTWPNGDKRASVIFKPGHFQTKFKAYKSIEDGAEDYLKFISQKRRYMKAFEFLKQGDPVKYSYALGEAGYYTADPKRYTAGVVRLFDEFIERKEELMSWKPEPNHIVEDDIPTNPYPAIMDLEDEIDTVTDNPKPELIDQEDFDTIPSPPPEEVKQGTTVGFMFFAALTSVWLFFSNFFQSCN